MCYKCQLFLKFSTLQWLTKINSKVKGNNFLQEQWWPVTYWINDLKWCSLSKIWKTVGKWHTQWKNAWWYREEAIQIHNLEGKETRLRHKEQIL